MTSTEDSGTDRQGLDYYPWWLDELADDATWRAPR